MKLIFKNILVIMLFLVHPFSLQAAPLDQTLQQIQDTYNKVQDLSSEFSQKILIESLGKQIEKQGKSFFKKPGKFKVEYAGEAGRVYMSNGKKMWVYEKGDTQVQVVNLDEKALPSETLSFLGGLGNIKSEFLVSEIKKDDSLNWLKLIPKNKASKLEEMILGFDKKTNLVSQAILKNESGNTSQYNFQNIKTNSSLADSEFEYTHE